MNLKDIFTTPFKLVASRTFFDTIPSLKVNFKTKNIYDKTTKEEIIHFIQNVF